MMERTDTGLGPGEKGRLFAWNWGYLGRAALDMFRATGEERFLSLVSETAERLLAERDDSLGLVDNVRGRTFPSWGTLDAEGIRSNEVTTAGLITLPILEYASLVGDKQIASTAIESLLAFRDERRTAEFDGYYFVHQAAGVVEAINHSNVFGAALAHASMNEADPWLKETALGLFRYQMYFTVRGPDNVAWPYAPAPNQASPLPSEAIWKAAASLELPIALAETEILPDLEFIEELKRSFVKHPAMARGDLPQFIGVDRVVPVSLSKISTSLPGFVASYFQLDDEGVDGAIVSFMLRNPTAFPRGWKGGCRAMPMAYAHIRARGA